MGKREIRNYVERIRIRIVADLPNHRYFFNGGGWSSGRRILPTHRSGWPEKCSRSRLIHARGDAVGLWKFQSAISILTRGERRSRRTAKRLSISCKSTMGIAARGAPTHPEAGARVACLLLKCLHRPLARRNAPDIADFSSAATRNARPFAKIFCLRISFFFFFFSSYNIAPRAYENHPTFLLFFFFLSAISIKENDFELEIVSSLLCDLFFVTRESRDDSSRRVFTLRKYSGCLKKIIRDS